MSDTSEQFTSRLAWKVEGQHLFLTPPPNPKLNYDPVELEKDLHALMTKYKLFRLEARRP